MMFITFRFISITLGQYLLNQQALKKTEASTVFSSRSPTHVSNLGMGENSLGNKLNTSSL